MTAALSATTMMIWKMNSPKANPGMVVRIISAMFWLVQEATKPVTANPSAMSRYTCARKVLIRNSPTGRAATCV